MSHDEKTRMRLAAVRLFYREKRRMPSFSEMGVVWGIKSKNGVSRVVKRLERMGLLERDEKGRVTGGSLSMSLRMLGTVAAGFPSPAEEELADTISLDDMLIHNREASFLLKVSGDSMCEAGILPGDMVIVDKGLSPKDGDIVIAEVDGEWTMKYLKKRGGEISLVPANPKFKTIIPKSELKVAGVVTSVVRQYRRGR